MDLYQVKILLALYVLISFITALIAVLEVYYYTVLLFACLGFIGAMSSIAVSIYMAKCINKADYGKTSSISTSLKSAIRIFMSLFITFLMASNLTKYVFVYISIIILLLYLLFLVFDKNKIKGTI